MHHIQPASLPCDALTHLDDPGVLKLGEWLPIDVRVELIAPSVRNPCRFIQYLERTEVKRIESLAFQALVFLPDSDIT